MRVALIGNPNSGKSTLFNILTGSNQFIGNWPGVTVEKKTGRIVKHKDIELTDLPGIYSLTPNSLEEKVSRNYLLNEKPDVLVNIVDSSNIVRNLFLTTELMELDIPIVLALNKADLDDNREINVEMVSKNFAPAVSISARDEKGIDDLIDLIYEVHEKSTIPTSLNFPDHIENAIEEVKPYLKEKNNLRFRAIQVVEGNFYGVSEENIEKVKSIISPLETGDDSLREQVSQERYRIINKIVDNDNFIRANIQSTTLSDKIDNIVTNKFLGIPIFIAIMAFVYYISIVTIGTAATDFVNDVVVDEWAKEGATALLTNLNTNPILINLIVDGIIAGVGAVLGFIPQMAVLFLLLSILEQSGYMSRVALLLDKLFSFFGLSGKSFISLLVGTGCSVPGILATRTIEDRASRNMTILTTSFMPCSAKLPVISLIVGSFFPTKWWLAPMAYFIGIASVIVTGLILKKTKNFQGESIPFVMELPQYQIPKLKEVLTSVWTNVKSFMVKAGSIILISTIFIWVLSSFSFSGGFHFTENPEESILAFLGGLIAPLFIPLGFGNWQATSATIMGLVAKENLVSTYGVLTGIAQDAEQLVEAGNFSALAPITQQLTQACGLSFLLFNLLCAPCFAAVGAMKREFMSNKLTIFAVLYQTVFAYLVSFATYQIMTAIQTSTFTIWTVLAIGIIILGIYLIVRPDPYEKEKKIKKEVIA